MTNSLAREKQMKHQLAMIALASTLALVPITTFANEHILRKAIECNDPNGSLSFLERHFPSAFRKKIDGALIRCFREAKTATEYNNKDAGYRESKVEDSQFRGKVPTAAKSLSSPNLSGTLEYNSFSSDTNAKSASTVKTAKGFTTRTSED